MKKPIGDDSLLKWIKDMPEEQKRVLSLAAFSGYAFAFDTMKSAASKAKDQVYTKAEMHDFLARLMPDCPDKMPADFLEIVLERMVNTVDNTSKD